MGFSRCEERILVESEYWAELEYLLPEITCHLCFVGPEATRSMRGCNDICHVFFRLLHTAAPCVNKDAPKVAGLTVSVAAVSWWHSTVATPGRVPFTDKMRAG